MFKKLLLLSALLTGALFAQNVTVSGTVSNADGTPLAGGVVTATLTNSSGVSYDKLPYNPQTVNIPVQQVAAVLDSTGSFSLLLEPSSQVSGAQWTFVICSPSANAQCASVTQAITANTSISSALNNALISVVNPSGKATNALVSLHGGLNAISAWGDSLTFGNQDGAIDSYPNYLQSITGGNVIDDGVSSQTSTQIANRMLAAPLQWGNFASIWSGRNGSDAGHTLIGDINAMLAVIPPPIANKYLVLSVINQENEPSGSTNYNNIIAGNLALQAAYPNNYVDIRALLVAQYNPANLVDVQDHANDIPPYTLRAVTNHGTLQAAIASTSTCAISMSTPFGLNQVMFVDSEYILTSAGSGNSVTGCTRGYAGSTAATHSNGATYTGTDPLHLGANGYLFVAQTLAPLEQHYVNANLPILRSPFSNVLLGDGALNLGGGTIPSTNSVAVGFQALQASVTTSNNTAVGSQACFSAAAAAGGNVCIGSQSGEFGSSAVQDVWIGFDAGMNNISGNQNVGIGTSAMANAGTGAFDVAIGFQAGQTWSAASGNTAVGTAAGGTNDTGNTNMTYLGRRADSTVATGLDHGTAVGTDSRVAASSSIGLGRTGAFDVVIENSTFTVAGLPAAATYSQGCTWVSDGAASPVYLATAAGSGTLKLRVCSNGTVWQNH